jgi:hypothetical protein
MAPAAAALGAEVGASAWAAEVAQWRGPRHGRVGGYASSSW